MSCTDEALIQAALKARENSYCPYSGFAVGAAIECEDGVVFTGCNVENGAFSASVCAERNAIFKAVSEGKRKFTKIAIVGGKKGEKVSTETPPCGVCRQVMSEFCDEGFIIITYDGANTIRRTLKDVLPNAFGLK